MPAIVKSTMDSDGLNTNKSKRFLFDTIRHMLILTLLVSIPAAFYAQEIIALLYSSDFLPAVYPLKMMLYASIATAFTYPAVAYFVSKDRQFDMMKIHVAVLLCSLIWSYFLVKNNGLEGAVLSYVITTVVTAGCLLLLLFRDFKAIDRPLMLIKAFFASGISIYLVSFIDLGVPSIIAIIIGSSVYAVLFITMLWKLEILTEYERSSIINLVSRRDT
jgi:O-antigen/teichoic acid export membrane protein